MTEKEKLVDRVLIHSSWTSRLYEAAVHHKSPVVRVLGLTLIAAILVLRSARLYLRQPVPVAIGVAGFAALAARVGPLLAALLVLGAANVALLPSLHDNLIHNKGHRAGAEGFDGHYETKKFSAELLAKMDLPPGDACENTLEALQSLLARDAAAAASGGLPELKYVEFDVQETNDGELVVFHDATVARAFTFSGTNVARLKRMGLAFTERVRDMTLAQLRELDVGGRPGVKVPTLTQFLDCLLAARCPVSVAVEVKGLRTDEGRRTLIALCREYKEAREKQLGEAQQQQQQQQGRAAANGSTGGGGGNDALGQGNRKSSRFRRDLGILTVIVFPHHFAAAFGEPGGADWLQWAREFKAAGVPCRCCMFHWLDYLVGV